MEIAIDFDGTCVKHAYPKIGEGIGAEPVLHKLIAEGHNLILFTMRSGKQLEEAVAWFEDRSIPLYGVQSNPKQKTWTTSPKAYAQIYIDDAALGIPLVETDGERPWVDWEKVQTLLEEQGIIRKGVVYWEPKDGLQRKTALKWWDNLKTEQKELLHKCRRGLGWSPSKDHTELTGREIHCLYIISKA